MIRALARLVAGINGYQRPGEIAAGFAFGMILGILPGGNLLWWVLFFLFVLVKVNKGALLLAMLVGAALIPLLDPVLNSLGYAVLIWAPAGPIFTAFAALPLASFTRFNNSLVMGTLVLSPGIWIVSYLIFRLLLRFYRKVIRDRFIKPVLVPWLKKLPLIKYIVQFFEVLAKAAGAVWQ